MSRTVPVEYGFVAHLHSHQGLAGTLATLMTTRSEVLADGGREPDRVIGDRPVAGVEEGCRPRASRKAPS